MFASMNISGCIGGYTFKEFLHTHFLTVLCWDWVSFRADMFEGTASGAAWPVKHSVLLWKHLAASWCHFAGVQMMSASKRVSSFSPSLKELKGRKMA